MGFKLGGQKSINKSVNRFKARIRKMRAKR